MRLYRICNPQNTVDNSEKTDGLYVRMWITVWTVWKCMRLCTRFGGNEYARGDHAPRKNPAVKGIARFRTKNVYA